MTRDTPRTVVAEMECGESGCTKMVRMPLSYAESVKAGHHPPPLCVDCLSAHKAKTPRAAPRVSRAEERTATGPAPQKTTLTMELLRDGHRRRYTTTLVPSDEDKGRPEHELLVGFGKAAIDRARILASKGGRMGNIGAPHIANPAPSSLIRRAMKVAHGKGLMKTAIDIALKRRGEKS